MKVLPALLAILFLSFVAFGCQEREIVKEEVEIEKMIDPDATPGMMHTVYFWLDESLDDAAREDFVRGVKSLEAAPTVERVFIGPPAPTPSRGVVDNSYDYALILWFEDVAGHDAYQVSKTHLKFVEDHEAKFAKVVVHDNLLLD